jgi:hypothetical protein
LGIRHHLRYGTVALGAAIAAPAAAEPASIELRIRNAADVPLRCVLVLAHFVTIEHPALPPGATVSVVMQRDAAAGTLAIPRADGRAMMIENLLCGAAGRWDETRGEVPLLALRGATPARMTTACRIDERLACTAPASGGRDVTGTIATH